MATPKSIGVSGHRGLGGPRDLTSRPPAVNLGGMLTWEAIEDGFAAFIGLLRARPELWAEVQASRTEFFAGATIGTGAERRHMEWFLLERPSRVLGDVPVLALQDAWREELGGPEAELVTAFQQSVTGVFEVTSLVADEGLWVRDLVTRGEHPVLESVAQPELAVGDLLVGRLYPVGGGAFRLSPTVACFRNPELVAAVRADLERMQGTRRGVLRVQQRELELFHALPTQERATPADVRRRGREALLELGLEPSQVDALLVRLKRGARERDGGVVREALSELAFETAVDLERARLVLAELWDAERGEQPRPERVSEPAVGDVRAALEAFDRGRAEGRDLDQLFAALERELGVDGDEGDDEDPSAPDFPGVVGAMVEEFLWETEHEHGTELAERYAGLRKLGEYGRDIGVFEELDTAQLLDFSARWLLDRSGVREPAEAEQVLDALAAFCRWCEEAHDLPLWTRFGTTLEALRADVPRFLRLRHTTPELEPEEGAFRVVRLEDGRAVVSDPQGRERELVLTPAQQRELRREDVVRMAEGPAGAVLVASYPKELGEFLEGFSG